MCGSYIQTLIYPFLPLYERTLIDIIGKQVRMHGGFYPGMNNQKPPFELPVVYEDDHFAVGECWLL